MWDGKGARMTSRTTNLPSYRLKKHKNKTWHDQFGDCVETMAGMTVDDLQSKHSCCYGDSDWFKIDLVLAKSNKNPILCVCLKNYTVHFPEQNDTNYWILFTVKSKFWPSEDIDLDPLTWKNNYWISAKLWQQRLLCSLNSLTLLSYQRPK